MSSRSVNQQSNQDIINDYKGRLHKLNDKINDLQNENWKLSSRNYELSTYCTAIPKLESQIKLLNETLLQQESQIWSLQKQIEENKTRYWDELHEKDTAHRRDWQFYRGMTESVNTKVENANYVMKLNDRQDAAIIEMSKHIDKLIHDQDAKTHEIAIKHENQFTNWKKKMMDHIKTAQKNMAQSNMDNMDLNTKLEKLTTNQLLIELEEQSIQIEDWLKIKEKKDKEIFEWKTDWSTHKKVEQILQEKNKKYLDMVKACDKKLNDKQNIEDNKLGNGLTNKLSGDTATYAIAKKYEKWYLNQYKKYKTWKGHFESLQDKQKYYEKKFSGIINWYKLALDDLIKDEELQKAKNIAINLDKIKNGDFETFDKKEKYSILGYLIKRLLPWIYNEDEDEGIIQLKEQFKTVDIDYDDKKNFMMHHNSNSPKFQKAFKTTNSYFYNTNYSNTSNNSARKNSNYKVCNTTGNNFRPKKNPMKENSNVNIFSNKDRNSQTWTKFPKIDHWYAGGKLQQKETNPLYRFLNISS